MSVKRKFLICAVLLVILPLAMILLLGAISWGMFALFQPTVQVSLAGGIVSSHPVIFRFVFLWAGLSLLVVVAAGAAVFVYLYRSSISPLKEFEAAMQHLEQGDLDYEFVGSGDTEIQQLCQAYEKLRHKLRITVEEQLEQERENRLMLANISHDIKTPVTAIRGYVEGILDGVAQNADQQEKYLKTICAKANTIELMAENLSLYAKLEMKRMQYQFAVEDIRELLLAALEESELDMKTGGMRLQCELPPTPCWVKMDKAAMKRVFANLIGNAIKYKKDDTGTLTVSGEITEHGVLLKFADSGIGISQTDLKRIFEVFYRGDPSRNGSIAGNGLGLAICQRIIKDHGGKIWIRSESGEGTEVMVLLPLRKGREL